MKKSESNMISTHYKTKNRRGFMHPFSTIEKEFILLAKTASPVIDMGCAYGNLVSAALEAGSTHVIACDMEEEHLKVLEHTIKHSASSTLQIMRGMFPGDFDFKKESIGAIHASHILEYLNGSELMLGLEKFYRWLKPNGKLFVLCYTIFIKELANEVFRKEYAQRKKNGEQWPGYLKNFDDFSTPQDCSKEIDDDPFPPSLHLYENSVLTNALKLAGFSIERADYLDGQSNGATEDTWLDGREYIGIIAVKSSSP